MRNPTDVLNSLNKQSKDLSYKFQRLYRNLYNPEFYLLAYRNIYANEGSMTPGVDGETLDGMSSPRIERIISALKDRSYRPKPARRTYIAKKNSSKKRPLGIPSGDDKLVQEVVRMILETFMNPLSPTIPTDSARKEAVIQPLNRYSGHLPGQIGLWKGIFRHVSTALTTMC